MDKHIKITLFSLLLLSQFFYLVLYFDFGESIILFFLVSLINSAAFLVIIFLIKKKVITNSVKILIISGILFRISVIFLPPTASDDIYRYIWDGKVQANHINPYKFTPGADELKSLHSDMLPKYINHPNMQSIYPPFAQYIFFCSYSIFGENYYGLKFILLLFEGITIFVLFLTLKSLNIPQEYIGIYSICPLPIMQFMIDGHIDAVGISLLVIGIYFFIRKKYFWSYLFLGFSIASKLITGMILPFLGDKKNIKWILSIMIPLIVFALTYIPYVSFEFSPFQSLTLFTKNWKFNGSIFEIIYNFFIEDNQKARLISGVIFAISFTIFFFSKLEITQKIVLVFLFFLLCNPTVHPWYVTWLAALLPLSFRWSGIAFIISVNLANVTVINYLLKGNWNMPDYILVIEYVPVFTLLLYEFSSENKYAAYIINRKGSKRNYERRPK